MQNSSKVKIIGSIIGVIVLVAGVAIGILLVRQQQDIREKAAPATALTIEPSTTTKNPGNTVDFSVVMDTGPNQVIGFQADLEFDPTVMQIVSVSKGSSVSSFDQAVPSNNFDNATGTLVYRYYTLDKTRFITGPGIQILTISAVVKNDARAGNYQIKFSPNVAVAGLAENSNVLTNASPATLVITAPLSAATPTPTGSNSPVTADAGTPTPTPSGIGTPAPSTSPTPTSTPNVGGVILPTSTPTVRPTNSAISTAAPVTELPNTGFDLPTTLGIGVALILLITSAVLLI